MINKTILRSTQSKFCLSYTLCLFWGEMLERVVREVREDKHISQSEIITEEVPRNDRV